MVELQTPQKFTLFESTRTVLDTELGIK